MYGRNSSRTHLSSGGGTSTMNSSTKSTKASSSIRALSYLFPIPNLWSTKYSKTADEVSNTSTSSAVGSYSGKTSNINAKQDDGGNTTYYLSDAQRQRMRSHMTIPVKPAPSTSLLERNLSSNNLNPRNKLSLDDHYSSPSYGDIGKAKSTSNMLRSPPPSSSSMLSNSGANTLSNKKKVNPIGQSSTVNNAGYFSSNSSLGESINSPTKLLSPKPSVGSMSNYKHMSSSTIAPMTSLSAPPTPGTTTAAATSSSSGNTTKKLCCDKCDGNHETDNCPYFKKKRDDHPDAQRKSNKQMGSTSSLPGAHFASHEARVIRQPGDGSCLFHSMSYGLGGTNASRLRSEVCNFISNNPSLMISETPLKDWVKWDSGGSVGDYVRKMNRGSWGGGIEMACVSQMKQVNVHVYERVGSGYKRISAFDYLPDPKSKPIVRVLYCGGVHYDALVA